MEHNLLVLDLSRPEAYPHRPAVVEVLETHISWIFFAGDLVYKVKKPVDFGFLDFTTLEKRLFYCQEEVRLNRRLCPDLYLGVEPVSMAGDDRLALGTGSPVQDYAVKMKRFPAENLMPACLARGEVHSETIERIAAILVNFYRAAQTGPAVNPYGSLEAVKHNIDEDFWQTADFVGQAMSPARFDFIQVYSDSFLAQQVELFKHRVNAGYIREGHGDLHTGNICLGDELHIFDCIEFNPALRCGDVAADLAFLAMDLDYHQRPDLGSRLIETYVELSGDKDLFRLIDFYKCYRAYVRGKICCFAFDRPDADPIERSRILTRAQRYFDLAYQYAGGRRRPRILVFFGLMGSGKTHWARATGQRLSAPVISSDRMRKQMAGLTSDTRVYLPFGQGLYSEEISTRVYQTMHESAAALAGAGLDVILDASYLKHAHRRQVLDLASHVEAEVTFIWTHAPEDVVLGRLHHRENLGRSLSDGRRELLAPQTQAFEPVQDLSPARLITLDTSPAMDQVAVKLWNELD